MIRRHFLTGLLGVTASPLALRDTPAKRLHLESKSAAETMRHGLRA